MDNSWDYNCGRSESLMFEAFSFTIQMPTNVTNADFRSFGTLVVPEALKIGLVSWG